MSDQTKEKPRSDGEWEDKHRRILKAATNLFLVLGYEGTTMKQVARNSDFSVGYLYKHFRGKKEILNELIEVNLDLYDGIRKRVREGEGLVGLGCLRRELQLTCELMADKRSLIPIVHERQFCHSEKVLRRLAEHRREDIQLLDEARLRGDIPDLDPAILFAVMDGAIWALFRDLAQTQRREVFLSIPDIIDRLVFAPLRRSAASGPGKDLLEI